MLIDLCFVLYCYQLDLSIFKCKKQDCTEKLNDRKAIPREKSDRGCKCSLTVSRDRTRNTIHIGNDQTEVETAF